LKVDVHTINFLAKKYFQQEISSVKGNVDGKSDSIQIGKKWQTAQKTIIPV